MTSTTVRRDRRAVGVLLTALLVLAGGAALHSSAPLHPAAAPSASPPDELRERFAQAVLMLHAKQYEPAAVALHRVLEMAPELPEAHVNMGFALLGLGRAAAARDFFESATALRPAQANAYYGLALADEALGDLARASAAMRSYLHLARGESDAHLRRARAALWEWEAGRAAADSRKRETAAAPDPGR